MGISDESKKHRPLHGPSNFTTPKNAVVDNNKITIKQNK